MTKKQIKEFMFDEYVSYMTAHHINMNEYRKTENNTYLDAAKNNAAAANAIEYMAYMMFDVNFNELYLAQL